jgi:PAS domain S-box-containing protein
VDRKTKLRFLTAAEPQAALIRAHDWSATPIGPPAAWPAALCTLLEVMLGAAQPMFLAWGTAGTILYNTGYAEILGSKHPQALGRPLLEVWREIRDDLLPIVEQVCSGVPVHIQDITLVIERHGYPEEAHFAFSYTPVRDGETGMVAGFFCACTETTAHVLAERRLRDSEAQFRALAEAVPNHAWTARPDGYLEWFNKQVYTYSGLGRDALVGQGWTQIVYPQDAPIVADVWTRSLATGNPYEIEFRIRRADGTYRWHIVRAKPIRNDNGTIVRWVGTNTDIEEQRVATDSLAALNAELEQRVAARTAERDRVWQNSRDLLAVIDSCGRFRAANPAWMVILGHAPQDVVGRNMLDLVWPDDAAPTQTGLEMVLLRHDLTNFENRFCHKNGTPHWISWHTSVEGDLVYAYGRDITAEKEQAEALRQTEEALRQSQKMEAVGQLTGGLAHDFNNLLTGITGSLELIQRRLAQGRLAELDRYFVAAQGAARRAAALTHRLLAFSRRQTLDPKPTDVNRLVGGMEELIRRTVGPAVAIKVVAAAGLWTTLVDRNQLENALLNLCINARDAMPDGGRLTIETANKWMDARAARERELSPGQYISLCVTDTGSGMTPEVMRRAFDPFYTTKPIGMGTGLGLSMIYGFVRQSGGQARIHSELGHGATVCLYLPRHLGRAEEADVPLSPTEPQRAEDGQAVMIVDDEVTVRMLVAEVLEERGYTAIEAADGPAGLRILSSDRRIDLLITDVGLPGGINGRQLADAARIQRPGLKVLFITGYAENAVVGNGYLEPGMHVLTKPFTIEALATRLADIIGGQK